MSAIEYISGLTLNTTATTVTFSNVPSNYTDLRVVANQNTSGTPTVWGCSFQFNGDTGSNYSNTFIIGPGTTSASTLRVSNRSNVFMASESYDSSQRTTSISNIMNYASTNMFKSVMSLSANPGFNMIASCGLWRNTAAITSITLLCTDNGSASTPFTAGSVFSLWGVR